MVGAASATGAIEQAIVARIKATMGLYLPTVDTIPADITTAELKKRLHKAPAALVCFAGGEGRMARDVGIVGTFVVYVVMASLKEEVRRHGSASEIGAYAAIEAIATIIADNPLPDLGLEGVTVGVPRLKDITRIYSDEFDRDGKTVYGAAFAVEFTFPPFNADDDLTDFATFLGQIPSGPLPHDVAIPLPPDTQDVTEALVTLDTGDQ